MSLRQLPKPCFIGLLKQFYFFFFFFFVTVSFFIELNTYGLEYSKSPHIQMSHIFESACKANFFKSNKVSLVGPNSTNTIVHIVLYYDRFIILFTQIIHEKQAKYKETLKNLCICSFVCTGPLVVACELSCCLWELVPLIRV